MYTVWYVDYKKVWNLCHGGDNLQGALKHYVAQVIRHGADNVRLCRDMKVQLDLTASLEYPPNANLYNETVKYVAGESEGEDGS